MPVHGNIYAGFAAANKSLATLGELAAQKDEQQYRQMQQQVSLANMRRLQEQADREAKQQQQEDQQQQQISALAQKHSQGGVFDQEGFLKDLQATGNLPAVEKATKILADTNKVTFDTDKAKRDADKEQGLEVSAQFRDLLNLPDEQAAPLYQQYRSRLVTKHPALAADIPETYDKTAVGHLVQAPLDHKDFIEGRDKVEAEATDNVSRILVRLALAKPEEIPGIFALGVKVGVPQQLTDLGLTPDSVAAMTPEQRRQLLYQAKGVTTDAVISDTKPKAAASGVNAGSFEDYVLRYAKEKGKAPEDVTTAEIESLRKRYQQADDRPPSITVNTGAGSDVAETVRGMKDGSLPPQLPGRASKEYIALMAEAHRQGFDLAGAATDWVATQKHIASLNGAQQLRLNQAVNQLPELLDSVDALASKWKAGRFPMLNSATLKLAKAGTLGREAASIANQLDAQIADVTGDLGAVYMGGNSPTDHSLQLAEKALRSDWDEKVLHDMVALARKNVQTRRNSISNTGVQGASADNPYAPSAVPAPSAAPANLDPAALRQRYNY